MTKDTVLRYCAECDWLAQERHATGNCNTVSFVIVRLMQSNSRDWHHLAAGCTGGFVSTLVLHPLDLLKIRFAVNEGNANVRPQYGSYLQASKEMVRSRGVTALFQGAVPNVVGNMAAWGLYLQFYSQIKKYIFSNENRKVMPYERFGAGIAAGVATLALTNPIWVAKTRLCLQYENQNSKFNGFIDTIWKTYKIDGVKGLYKGFVPGILGTSHGAVHLMAYEELKLLYCRYKHIPLDSKLDTGPYLVFSATSKMFAVMCTYPYQVVRSRLQDQHVRYNGVLDVIRKTWTLEGPRGFYKGLLPSLLRVTPAACITFVIYENMLNELKQ